MDSVNDILDEVRGERERQINAEGYDSAHDDAHDRGELAIQAAELCVDGTDAQLDTSLTMPCWGVTEKHRGNRRRQLVIAAALMVAEIERIDRRKK
jgi:hypothetical protein